MRKLNCALFTTLLFTLLLQPALAHEKGTWFSKFGPALITPNDDSNSVDGIPNSRVDVDSNVTLGFTLGYMFTDRVGLEFLGMTPSNHDLRGRDSLSTVGKLADVDVLPPTLILQYHFNEYGKFHPFIGAGINYTLFFDENVRSSVDNALGGNTSLDIDDSYGLALQAGLDYMLNDRWYLNASLWYVDIDADATLTTNGVDRDVDVDIDPWVLFTGIGVKF